jgi:aspartokinase
MVTIAHIVGKILSEKPFLDESLEKGIISFGGLADLILPDLEKELGKKVKHSAVMMAIRRYQPRSKLNIYDKRVEVTASTGIFEVTVHKSHNTPEIMEKIYSLDVLSVVTGTKEISIIARNKKKEQILDILKDIKQIEEDLAAVMIPISKEAVNSVGMFYHFTKLLAWENISIIEVVSTLTEASFIIKKDDLPRAIKALA